MERCLDENRDADGGEDPVLSEAATLSWEETRSSARPGLMARGGDSLDRPFTRPRLQYQTFLRSELAGQISATQNQRGTTAVSPS